MYWQDESQEKNRPVNDTIVDVVFAMKCTRLPVDHAYALSNAIQEILPWFQSESGAALHTIHVAASGNGWVRPDDFIHPSRRTKLALRVPKHRIADVQTLTGKTLPIGDHAIEIGAATTRMLSTITTIFARYVATRDNDEEEFLTNMVAHLRQLDIKPKKMLCGIEHNIRTADGELRTRSLMLANLSPQESVMLQQRGIGTHQHLGCGVFIPHRDIQELK